eukprot:SAG11_NODE_838_length_6918_cov_3.566945_3_plen_324_part_00
MTTSQQGADRDQGPSDQPSTVVAGQLLPLSEHLAEFKAQGFTVFRGQLPAATIAALRQELVPLFATAFDKAPHLPKLKLGVGHVAGQSVGFDPTVPGVSVFDLPPAVDLLPDWVGGGLLNHPRWDALRPYLRHPWHSERVLDFCELAMGPCVQLDSFGISGFPASATHTAADASTAAVAAAAGAAISWHRDNFEQSQYYAAGPGGGYWGGFGPYYRRPLGMNLLCYLQDLDAQTGSLRLVPGSHLGSPPTPSGGPELLPHPQEHLLALEAGDLVALHSDLLHSGSPNRSATELRFYTSTYLCQLGMPHRDFFDAPVMAATKYQ